MAAFPPSVHAPKRVVAGFREGLALIPSLEMAATDVEACRRKHATRKPVTVETFVSNKLCLFLCVMLTLTCLNICCNCLVDEDEIY